MMVDSDGSFNNNSYNAPDSVNKIDWTTKEEYNDLFNYYKGLMELRKSHKAFRMNTSKDIQNNLTFLEKGKLFTNDNVVAYTLNGENVGDSWKDIAVIFNANKEPVEITLPMKDWAVIVNGNKAGTQKLDEIKGNKVHVPAQSSYVLVQKDSFNGDNNGGNTENPDEPDNGGESENPDKPGNPDDDGTNKPSENSRPTIDAKDLELNLGEKFDPLKGVTAFDKEDGDLTSKIQVINNNVDPNKAGKYKVTYMVVDKNGNKVTKTINVNVLEKSSGGNLPNTGGTSALSLGIIGLILVGVGIIFFRKRKNN